MSPEQPQFRGTGGGVGGCAREQSDELGSLRENGNGIEVNRRRNGRGGFLALSPVVGADGARRGDFGLGGHGDGMGPEMLELEIS
jgi:hypothetical protein